MRARFFRFDSALVLFTLTAALAFPGQDVSEFEKRISLINGQIKEIKAKIQEEEKKESSILSALSRIGLVKSLIRKEIEANAVLLEKTNRELNTLQEGIVRLQAKLDQKKQSIEKILVTIYKFGRFDFLQFVFKTENIEFFLIESKNLSVLARYQETLFSSYAAAMLELRDAQSRIEEKREEISSFLLDSAEKKKELEAEESRNRRLIEDIQRDKNTYKQTLEELGESADQLQILIKKIINQQFTFPSPFIPLYERRGKLAWPIEGKVITNFGRQKHQRFNTITINNGIEVAPKKNKTVIQSIHAGRIVYADTFEGYGNLIIIDHGLSYYSLYGHCSGFQVAKGDFVKAGQPIALVGDTGSLNGLCLYFEIRFKARALDPLQWLKRR